MVLCCISFDSYIKPQLGFASDHYENVVYLLIPTSNHNVSSLCDSLHRVVYLLIPTSNHNCCLNTIAKVEVVYLLIPTSNHNYISRRNGRTHVVYLLIPTSNHNSGSVKAAKYQLYIFWFLHQTTTAFTKFIHHLRCISFDSYIKPQLTRIMKHFVLVVYLLIPTSNHNSVTQRVHSWLVVYLLIPTSNHNWSWRKKETKVLYIFWFLHQTTTILHNILTSLGCISFDSYIKPQLRHLTKTFWLRCISFDSYIKPQLQFWWLWRWRCCISFDSYIKPQLAPFLLLFYFVVYLLIPTSNHNVWGFTYTCSWLYIFWFLHQTTTLTFFWRFRLCCISFDSYIKPQLCVTNPLRDESCISFDSYIKPQLT